MGAHAWLSALAGLLSSVALASGPHTGRASRPMVTISSPASGATYILGQAVPTRFRCTATSRASKVVRCRDSSGRPSPRGRLGTSAVGLHSYTVTAATADGLSASASVSYVVTTPQRTASHTAGGGGPTSAGPTPAWTAAAGADGNGVVAFNRETYDYSSRLKLAQEANRYQFIVLSAGDHALVPLLKVLNPQLKVLVYQSIVHTNAKDPDTLPTDTGCTPYAADVAQHPEFILRDGSGAAVLSKGHTKDLYLTDVGNPAYQRACAADAIAMASRLGFDGVFWDEVTGYLRWITNPGLRVPEYPNDSGWTAAMTSAVRYIGPQLRAHALISIANLAAPDAATWKLWAEPLDGVEEEGFTDGGMGPAQQIPYFGSKLAELAWTQAHGKYELVHSYNGGEAANTYGLAAMLLAADGTASYSTSNTDYGSEEHWFPEYTQALKLGAPAGGYTRRTDGVYERVFAHGLVLVNPTATAVPAIALGGVYSGSGLSGVRSVAMPPTSGRILLRDGG